MEIGASYVGGSIDGKDTCCRSSGEEGGSRKEKGARCELHVDGWMRDELGCKS